jgi:hypothetical protein
MYVFCNLGVLRGEPLATAQVLSYMIRSCSECVEWISHAAAHGEYANRSENRSGSTEWIPHPIKSGWSDLNRRPLRPKRSALADCATPRSNTLRSIVDSSVQIKSAGRLLLSHRLRDICHLCLEPDTGMLEGQCAYP